MANKRRLIDANGLLEELEKFANPMPNKSGYDFLCGVASAITEVENAHTVDAVEVVYCKDCKSHHWEQEPCHGKTVHICSKLKAEVTRDFYCAAGERREVE